VIDRAEVSENVPFVMDDPTDLREPIT